MPGSQDLILKATKTLRKRCDDIDRIVRDPEDFSDPQEQNIIVANIKTIVSKCNFIMNLMGKPPVVAGAGEEGDSEELESLKKELERCESDRDKARTAMIEYRARDKINTQKILKMAQQIGEKNRRINELSKQLDIKGVDASKEAQELQNPEKPKNGILNACDTYQIQQRARQNQHFKKPKRSSYHVPKETEHKPLHIMQQELQQKLAQQHLKKSDNIPAVVDQPRATRIIGDYPNVLNSRLPSQGMMRKNRGKSMGRMMMNRSPQRLRTPIAGNSPNQKPGRNITPLKQSQQIKAASPMRPDKSASPINQKPGQVRYASPHVKLRGEDVYDRQSGLKQNQERVLKDSMVFNSQVIRKSGNLKMPTVSQVLRKSTNLNQNGPLQSRGKSNHNRKYISHRQLPNQYIKNPVGNQQPALNNLQTTKQKLNYLKSKLKGTGKKLHKGLGKQPKTQLDQSYLKKSTYLTNTTQGSSLKDTNSPQALTHKQYATKHVDPGSEPVLSMNIALHPKINHLITQLGPIKYPKVSPHVDLSLPQIGPHKNSDGSYYEGHWLNGKMHGRGTWISSSGISFYEGEFKFGKRNGYGRCVDFDGTVKEGPWVNSWFQGKEQKYVYKYQ
jgi:hypothetical protein